MTAALDVAAERSGTWFDPDLVAALLTTRGDRAFWSALGGDAVDVASIFEPADRTLMADDTGLDNVAEAFATVVDASRRSRAATRAGVARIALGVAATLGFDADRVRDLRRCALLHDLGKLGVSNLVLDKPGKLDADEWAQIRGHAALTVRILERVPAFRDFARDAARPPRAPGRPGYHLGLTGGGSRLDAAHPRRRRRVRGAHRRPPVPRPAGLGRRRSRIMRRDVGAAFCPEYFEALESWVDAGQRSPGITSPVS